MKANIPESVEACVTRLNGLGALLTATEWERAAIVATFVTAGNVGDNQHTIEPARSSSLSPVEFAALGITGLRSKDTVRRYHDAWMNAGQPRPKPGDTVALPEVAFDKVAAPPSGGYNGGNTRTPTASDIEMTMAKADRGDVAKVIARTLADDPSIVAKVHDHIESPEAREVVADTLQYGEPRHGRQAVQRGVDDRAMVEESFNGPAVQFARVVAQFNMLADKYPHLAQAAFDKIATHMMSAQFVDSEDQR